MRGPSRRSYYDLFSHFYDFVITLHSRDRSSALRDLLVETASVAAGRRLLDICTGTGAVALRAQQATGPDGAAVGLDFSQGMIRKAREKARRADLDRVYFVVGDAAHLPFRSSSFEAVTCSHAMYELSPEVRTRALEEAQRVLQPAGRFLMMEHCEPTRPFVRLLYQIRLATMGSARNRSFARDEVPFLSRFFRDVKRQLSSTGRSKLIWGVKDRCPCADGARADSAPTGAPRTMSDEVITFGPVPSRRLGQSLGINNIPPKFCPYSCLYCQVGPTPTRTIDRRAFFRPEEIVAAATRRVREIQQRGEPLDFLTFVADGEPTLDIHLGRAIELLRSLGVKIAVISNASLLWREDVRESLQGADWVSLKVDTVREEEWHRLNRPHRSLRLGSVLRGMLDFSESFEGQLVTETMLVDGVNEGEESIAKTRGFLEELRPSTSYLGVPIRPTAEPGVRPAHEPSVNRACQLLLERLPRVRLLTDFEGPAFGTTGDLEVDLLSITSVHPLPEDAVRTLLARGRADWSVVEGLIERGLLVETEYQGRRFYGRRFTAPGSTPGTGTPETF